MILIKAWSESYPKDSGKEWGSFLYKKAFLPNKKIQIWAKYFSCVDISIMKILSQFCW